MKNIYLILGLMLLVLGCKKPPPEEEPLPEGYANGIIVVNEGLYQQNNASISFYSNENETVQQQAFMTVNGRGLGDTANDLVAFTQSGSPYFCVAVDVSSQLEIIHSKTLKSVGQVSLIENGVAKEPRRVVTTNGKIYACNFDGTVSVINISTLYISRTIQVGENPDGLAVSNGKIYVSNSGGLNAPNYDSTITVIDVNTDSVIKTIDARINCTASIAGQNNDVYVISNGDYGAISKAMLRIDTNADSVTNEYSVNITSWAKQNEWLYYYDADLNGVYRFDMNNQFFENAQIIDGSNFTTPYTMAINNDRIYLADANGYVNSSTVRVYNMSGTFIHEFTAGLNATGFLFNN